MGFFHVSRGTEITHVLELKASELILLSLYKQRSNIHIQVFMDNTTNVAYINKYGGRIKTLDNLARTIWTWAIDKNIFIAANRISGSKKHTADKLSRTGNDDL